MSPQDHTVLPYELDAHQAWWSLTQQGSLRPEDSCALCRGWERRWQRNQQRDHRAVFERRRVRALEAGFESYHHQRRARSMGLSAEEYEEMQAMVRSA